MSNQIIPFNYNQQQIRVLKDEKGEPWFVAKDVCDVLGISNNREALTRVRDFEKGVRRIDTLGGPQNMSVVSESGLYRIAMRSDKPEAQPFIDWLAIDVLPTLRKTGSYSIAKTEPVTLIPIAKEFKAAVSLAKSAGLQGNQATFAANTAIYRMTGYDCLDILGTKQLVNEDQEVHLTPTQIATRLNLKSAQAVNKSLQTHGFQIPAIGDVKWQPTEKGKIHSILKDAGKAHKTDGRPIQQLMWKETIIEALKEEIKKKERQQVIA